MRKVILLLGLLLFTNFKLQSQNKSVLVFSDAIQAALFNHLTDTNLKCKDNKYKYYARISSLGMDTVQINLCKYEFNDKGSSKTKLVLSGNTLIKIKNIELPVLHDIDFMFSSYIKRIGKDGLTYEDNYPRGGFFVVFNKYHDEKVIRTGFEQ